MPSEFCYRCLLQSVLNDRRQQLQVVEFWHEGQDEQAEGYAEYPLIRSTQDMPLPAAGALFPVAREFSIFIWNRVTYYYYIMITIIAKLYAFGLTVSRLLALFT